MSQRLDVDLDSEKVMIDGTWLGRADLSARIKQMMDSGDYKGIGRLGAALEALVDSLASARVVSFKLAGDNYGKLEAAGQKLGKSAAEFARDLLVQVLGSAAALPAQAPAPAPVIAPGPAPIIAAADVSPEEAAVALTMKPKVREPAASTATPAAVQPVAAPPAAPAPAAAPGAPAPSVVVDLGAPEDPGRPKAGERRWFNR